MGELRNITRESMPWWTYRIAAFWSFLGEYERAAEVRWRYWNAVHKARGCPCGRPATKVQFDTDVVGRVPYEYWTCDEHEGADGFTRQGDQVVATYKRPSRCSGCDEMCSSGGTIGQPTEYYYCPERIDTTLTRPQP